MMKVQRESFFSPLMKVLLATIGFLPFNSLLALLSNGLYGDVSSGPIFVLGYLFYTLFFIKVLDKQTWKALNLSFNKKSVKGFLLSFLLTAALIFLGSVIARFLFHDNPFQIQRKLSLANIFIYTLTSFSAAFLVQGFPEELIFRGYMTQALRTKYSPIVSLFITSGLFTLIHAFHIFREGLVSGLLTMFIAFSLAFLAYLLKCIFETTWAAVAVHGGVHFTRMMLVLLGFSESHTAILMHSLFLLLVALIIFYRFRDRLTKTIEVRL